MDRITKGMSESGRKAPGYCQKSDPETKSLLEKAKEFAQETAQKVNETIKKNNERRKAHH